MISAMKKPHLGWKVPAAALLIAGVAWGQAPGPAARAGVARGGVEAPRTPARAEVALDGVKAPPLLAPQAVRSAVREYRQQHEMDIARGYADLLSVPNVASDTANIHLNAERIQALLQARGFQTRLLAVPGSPPVVFGELPAAGARHTILWYAHYDGQPVDPSQWASGPWTPTLRDGLTTEPGRTIALDSLHAPLNPEWRLYARAASDDKAPIWALLTALDALRANKIPLGVNLKVFFEGEEEAGSPHLEAIMRQNAELLKGDVWLLSDGPVHQTRRMQVYFGARGMTDVEMTVYGPARVLHDGHYGNWAPNPAALLTNLLASMRDANSHILIPGYYDDVRPLSAAEREALKQMPDVDAQLKQELGLAWTESSGQPLAAAIAQPSLNIRGLEAGHVESKAQNAISTEAKASLDLRLVPDQKLDKVRALMEQFIEKQGFYIVRQTPDLETRRAHAKIIKLSWGSGYPAERTSVDDLAVQPVIQSIEQTLGVPLIKMPMLGGSVPMYLFTDLLKTPVVGVPIVNHDNNQHGANENLRLQNLWDGIEIFAGILTGAERNWR
jgi:acetylornithine deacetylase/succinyl-diaminopimelate desuccinylase-like protein